MNQTVIDIQGITKTYVNGKLSVPVLHGIDLVVNKGEFVSIMGPSGSGKSTFMNILGCLDRPTTGSYRLNGDEVATLSDDELAYVHSIITVCRLGRAYGPFAIRVVWWATSTRGDCSCIGK